METSLVERRKIARGGGFTANRSGEGMYYAEVKESRRDDNPR